MVCKISVMAWASQSDLSQAHNDGDCCLQWVAFWFSPYMAGRRQPTSQSASFKILSLMFHESGSMAPALAQFAPERQGAQVCLCGQVK